MHSDIQPVQSTYLVSFQGNVLLDSRFHCQITDFGSTRHFEATVTRSTKALSLNFAAPELFGVCTECGQTDCDGCYESHEKQHSSKTMETDIYAFGCLYYAVSPRLVSLTYTGILSDLLHRYSSMLFLFMKQAVFKLCDLSWMENARFGWKVHQWTLTHGTSFRVVGSPSLPSG